MVQRTTRPARFGGHESLPAKVGAPGHARRPSGRRSGVIFVIALGVIVILSAMLLVYAQAMRTEALASANRLSAAQADAVEQGAEQWVLAQVETYTTPLSGNTGATNLGFGNTDITTIPAQALPVGAGYFWVLHPDPTQDQNYAFGIADENAKLNLNVATADQLVLLPNVTQEVADSIVDWVDTDETPTSSDGAESDYYGSLPEPYAAKNSAMDTVEELLLVKGVTPQVLYGADLNHDGVIDATEAATGGGTTGGGASAPGVSANGTADRRGLFNYVTVYTTRNVPGQAATAQPVRPGQVPQRTVGLINLNTAPEPVLLCLPGLSQADADALVAQRTQSVIDGSSTDLTWAQTALGPGKYQLVAPYVTAQSYQYSADIVAVSGDGRAYRRVRIVVDARTQPAKILYRKDLTSLGWPLSPDVRASLRAGHGVPADSAGAGAGVLH